MADPWALLLLGALSLLGVILYLAIHYSVRPGAKPGGIKDPLRRAFLKYSVLASLVLVLGHAWVGVEEMFRSLIRPIKLKPVYVTNLKELEPGSAVAFMMPVDPDMLPADHPCILIRFTPEEAQRAGRELVAYSARCTHLGCIVEYLKMDGREIYCPCHAGIFDPLTGNPISGPPKRPLPEVRLKVEEDGSIYAVGWVGRGEQGE